MLVRPLIWGAHAEVQVLMAALLFGYMWAVRVWGPKYTSPGEAAVTKAQRSYFALGVFLLWVGASSPVHDLAEKYLFSVHMLQHVIFSLVAAPFLLMGLPGWMVRQLIRPKPVMAVMSRLTRPVPALFAFNGYLLFSHWPSFVSLTLRSELFHFGAHAVLLGLSVVMWWPVLSPLPELPRVADFPQFLYVLAQTIAPTVPFAFLIFADKPLYSYYAHAPRIAGWLDAVTDQRVAGLVMKVGGSGLLWGVATVLFFRWYSNEEKGAPAAVEWQKLERELNKT